MNDEQTPRIQKLIEQLKDPDSNVRWSAAKALAKFGEKAVDTVPALIQALKDSDVRVQAAWTLSEIGKPAVPALIQALQDPNPSVCENAAWTLKKIGEPAIPFLAEAFKKQPELRPQIQEIFKKIKPSGSVGIREGPLPQPGEDEKFRQMIRANAPRFQQAPVNTQSRAFQLMGAR